MNKPAAVVFVVVFFANAIEQSRASANAVSKNVIGCSIIIRWELAPELSGIIPDPIDLKQKHGSRGKKLAVVKPIQDFVIKQMKENCKDKQLPAGATEDTLFYDCSALYSETTTVVNSDEKYAAPGVDVAFMIPNWQMEWMENCGLERRGSEFDNLVRSELINDGPINLVICADKGGFVERRFKKAN